MTKRFFFALSGGGDPSPDEIGAEFDSLDSAYLEGCRAALEISFDMLRDRIDPSAMKFEISDDQGTLLIDLPFEEVLRPGARRSRPSSNSRPPRDPGSKTQRGTRIGAELAELRFQTASTLASSREVLARARHQTSILHLG